MQQGVLVTVVRVVTVVAVTEVALMVEVVVLVVTSWFCSEAVSRHTRPHRPPQVS